MTGIVPRIQCTETFYIGKIHTIYKSVVDKDDNWKQICCHNLMKWKPFNYLGLKAIALVLPKSSVETGMDAAATKKAPEVDD